LVCRTNKAQYSDVSLQTVTEGDATMVSLPSMQGEDESEGMSIDPILEGARKLISESFQTWILVNWQNCPWQTPQNGQQER
jgi:hypothetical protein